MTYSLKISTMNDQATRSILVAYYGDTALPEAYEAAAASNDIAFAVDRLASGIVRTKGGLFKTKKAAQMVQAMIEKAHFAGEIAINGLKGQRYQIATAVEVS